MAEETPHSGEEIMAGFTRNLLKHEEALEYLAGRGIKRELVEQEEVGYCPSYSQYPFRLLRGRIVVPIRDQHGQIIAFAGRIYEPAAKITVRAFWEEYGHKPAEAQKLADRWQRGKWLNESFPKRYHLYGLHRAKHAARERGYMVLLEGYFDHLVLAGKFLPNNVALCGARLTEWHAAFLSRYCRRAVTLMDGDAAGEQAEAHMRERLEEAGIEPFILRLPHGLDPDEFVLKFGGKQLRRIIEAMLLENVREQNLHVK